jgi:Tetratricopeptide repeat
MREAANALLVLLFFCPACKSKPEGTPPPTPSASASAVASATKPNLADASVPLTEEEKKAHALSLAAVSKGRAAVGKKDFPAAIAAFDEAVKLSPRDAQPIGERGYVKFLSGDVNGAETDLEAARDLGSTPKVMASIWFNLGLVRERRADAEGARSAFATSQEISPTKAAAAKLVGLSTCAAEITATADDLQKAANWSEAAKIMQIDPAPANEKDAKDAVCIFSISADGSSDQHDQCDTAPPWVVAHDHLFFFAHSHIVFPAARSTSKLFIDEVGMVGGWPAHCTGQSGGSGKIIGHYGWTTKTYDGAMGVMFQPCDDTSGAVNLADMGDIKCGDAPGSVDDTFYDLKTGAALVNVRRPIAVSANAPLVHLDVQGSLVRISGAGCNTSLDLDSLHGGTIDAGKK